MNKLKDMAVMMFGVIGIVVFIFVMIQALQVISQNGSATYNNCQSCITYQDIAKNADTVTVGNYCIGEPGNIRCFKKD